MIYDSIKKPFFGCWPTMITPFTEDNKIDFTAVRGLTERYISGGCDGIFAVCQSSEMFFLSETEKLDLAKAVVEAAAGRVPVFASGHTADENAKQIEELGAWPRPALMLLYWSLTGSPIKTKGKMF